METNIKTSAFSFLISVCVCGGGLVEAQGAKKDGQVSLGEVSLGNLTQLSYDQTGETILGEMQRELS